MKFRHPVNSDVAGSGWGDLGHPLTGKNMPIDREEYDFFFENKWEM